MTFNHPLEAAAARFAQPTSTQPTSMSGEHEREKWIADVANIWAAKFGDKEPNENLKEYARAMADTWFDDPLWKCSPGDAVDEEISCV